MFRHRQLICVLREFGAVVVGILNGDHNCSSGPESVFFFIYGDHLDHQTITEISRERFQSENRLLLIVLRTFRIICCLTS